MVLLSHLGKGKKLPNPDNICQAEELCERDGERPGSLGQILVLGGTVSCWRIAPFKNTNLLGQGPCLIHFCPPMPGTYQVIKEEKQQMISKVQEWPVEVDIAQVALIS